VRRDIGGFGKPRAGTDQRQHLNAYVVLECTPDSLGGKTFFATSTLLGLISLRTEDANCQMKELPR